MKRILGVLLAGVLLLSGCGQWQKSQKESAYHLYCLDKTGTTLVQEPYEPKEGTDQKLIKDYQRTRIMSFLYPDKRPSITCAMTGSGNSARSSRAASGCWTN